SLLSPVLLTFGSATDNGTVRFDVNNLIISSTSSIHIAGGTLTGSRISDLTEFLSSTSVVSGATLDFEGRFAVVKNLQGAGLVKNDGSTTDIQAGAFSGKFTGTGNLNMNGSGTLTLTGNNDYTGTTTVTAGNLVVGNGGTSGNLGTGSIVNNATLSFNRSDDFALANALSGTGTLKKLGTGTLNYTGDGSVYSGVTSVVDGGLAVNGTLNGLINVDSGASLSGTGTTGSVTVASGGVLAPGNSIGTLNVNGNLNLDPGASYRVEADAAGASDKVIVTGNASLNGNVVALPQTGGTYKANTKYTILTANSITGNFNSSVSSSLAFLDASVTQDTNNVYLNLRRNDIAYAAVAQTPNQRGVANAIERVAATDNASTEMTTVVNTINNLSAGQARSAFESMSGAGLAGLQRVGMGFTGNFATQLNGRLQSAGMGRTAQSINGMQLAANDRLGDLMPALAQNTMSDMPSSSKFSLGGGVPVDDGKRGFWLRGFGFDQDTDGDGNAAGSRVKGVGISAGFDKRLQNNLVVGAAFSHSTSDVRASFAETGKSRGNALAAYASYASGPWTFNGNLILSHHENSMNRNVTVGTLTSTARANFDSKAISAYGEASYDLPQTTWTLQPLAGLSVTHNRSEGFTETGAGVLNIQADAQSITSTKTLLGARALFEFDGIHVQPRAIWAHELGDVNKGMTAQLQGSPAATFTTYGVELPRDSFIAGLTVAGRTAGGLSLFADVQSEFSSKQTGLALLVGVRKSW
ncbi:MAG: autotransporter domain-containing protein, partial [Oxalicibacterium faecigallinarum]|uniref:autotransporter family protein n=1 Tax=Oxalicibacterium faecigallinarum TaxID=573741 RepID=UPI002807AB1B